MNTFRYTSSAQEVIFGAGALDKLASAADAYGWSRLALLTTPSQRANGTVARLQAMLGMKLTGIYDHVSAHVPAEQVAEALDLVDGSQVEAVIGLGGGSAIGISKAVSMALEARRTSVEVVQSRYPGEPPLIPTIAIPTTYAGSEMTPTYGVTRTMDDGSQRKVTVRDGKITPRLVIYDPALTLALPPVVTASTGINALAHCVEAVYSATRNPLSTAAALLGIRHIAASLLRCFQHGDDTDARTTMLVGAHLAGQSLATVTMGLHHGTCHALGGTAGVPHGIANAIVLPHAIRFNADALAPLIAQAGEAIGIPRDNHSDEDVAELTAQAVHDLVAQMGLPQRLRDASVGEALLPTLAATMLKSKAVLENPTPITYDQALGLLRAMW